MLTCRVIFCSFLLVLCSAAVLPAQQYQPQIADASNEGQLALQGFKVPAAMTADLFAAEPLIANPCAFCIDEQGRIYVAETFRQKKGVVDNRDHMSWLLDDLASQSVDDRRAMFKKHLQDGFAAFEREHDRIRLLEDTNGDGVADKATVFADGFHKAVVGTGAGVLARRGDVFYTCIPDVWRLRDDDGDGRADQRELLHSGYGVRVAFRGHDLHGLTMGPDGRIYFSIGDRGYNVITQEGRRLKRPDTGAVFRCNPNGSQLEVFCYGLRNPQELAFDDYGNLFTGDNNSDSGDKARWVYLVEGGDTGWRMYYQYLQDRGPWNREKLWYPHFPGQAAYIVPPVANLADGPSGLVYYPGVGLSERYRGHFFMCDFRGTPARSGVRSFSVKPKGATFELTDSHEFIWKILGTDIDFGYDGSIYVSDWVNGWNGLGKGRLYRFRDAHADEAKASGAATLMAAGFSQRTPGSLVSLLNHADRRVRQEAQFALVEKESLDELVDVAMKGTDQLARIHGIWGIGQLARNQPDVMSRILTLLNDEDPEIRAQLLKVIADARLEGIVDELASRLGDRQPRVQYFAALALARCGDKSSIGPLVTLLEANNGSDPMLRHAIMMGLSGCAGDEELVSLLNKVGPATRTVIAVVLRRRQSDSITKLLKDGDSAVILEAARAINDEPIASAYSALAALADDLPLLDSLPADDRDALGRRVINANFRLGGGENVQRVANMAARKVLGEQLCQAAVDALLDWEFPQKLDRVTNAFLPVTPEKRKLDVSALKPSLPTILDGAPKIRKSAVQLAAKYGVTDVVPFLQGLVADAKNPSPVRATALTALAELTPNDIAALVEQSLLDAAPDVRMAAREVMARRDSDAALPILAKAADGGELFERQHAIRLLAESANKNSTGVLEKLLDQLLAGSLPAAIHLDLLDAAAGQKGATIQQQLKQFDQQRDRSNVMAEYLECLEGGNLERGSAVFFGRSDLSCRRCHQVAGSGGEVGPDLSAIGKDKDRRYLLESIVAPNKQIAKGFESIQVITDKGKIYSGIVKKDDPEILQLMLADGTLITILKNEIDERVPGKSAMPDDLVKKLSKADVRDLIEFLRRQKTPYVEAEHK